MQPIDVKMSEDFDLNDIPAETPLSPEEAITRRHRREKKDLQGKILAMKKTVTKNEKKKKKEIAEEIAKLEAEMETRHKLELDTFRPTPAFNQNGSFSVGSDDADRARQNSVGDGNDPNDQQDDGAEVDDKPSTPKLSKARKRREKKEAQQREIRKRIESETETLEETSEWKQEDKLLEEILKELKLDIIDIPSDGHCLYKAVSDQLQQVGEIKGIEDLRQETAMYLKSHQQEYINFFDEEIAESQEQFDQYCDEIISTAAWGGQVEVNILSNVLERPIKVLQAEGPPILFGEKFKKPELTLTYHRHKLKLGAHYNSTTARSEESELNPQSELD